MKIISKKFVISGVDCASCSASIAHALKKLRGVKTAEMNYMKSTAEVEFDTDELDEKEIIKLIGNLGYDVI